MLDIGSAYSGYKTVQISDTRIPDFYENKHFNHFESGENEYLLIVDETGQPVDRYKWQDGKYKS